MPEQTPERSASRTSTRSPSATRRSWRCSEAERCLECKNPHCVDGCPVGIDIPAFIAAIREGRLRRGARASSRRPTPCPPSAAASARRRTSARRSACSAQEGPAGGHRPARALRRRLGAAQGAGRACRSAAPPTGKKVAVVGCGPGRAHLRRRPRPAGHQVTVFEALHKPGGVLVYGIPEFRLPKEIVRRGDRQPEQMGVEIRCNFVVGKTATGRGAARRVPLRRGLHRHRRRAALLHGHPGRELHRRATRPTST